MFLTYTPEDGDAQRFEFRPKRVRASRAEMIEKRYGQLAGIKNATWDQFKVAIQQGSASARRVLLWHLLSAEHPTLKIDDVDPFEDEVELEYSKSELLEVREFLSSAPNIPEADLALMLAKVDMDIMTAPEDGSEGKAPSKTSADATGSPSPN
jgi:hypothetical protein